MRSILDPLPRPLSTKAVVLLVALVVLGTGVSVARYVDAAQPGVSPRPKTSWAVPRERQAPPPRTVRLQMRPQASGSAIYEIQAVPEPRPAPTQQRTPSLWRPQGG